MKVEIIGSKYNSSVWYAVFVGKVFDVVVDKRNDNYQIKGQPLWIHRDDCRPLKSAVAARSASANSDCAAALWKELRRRNGGRFPAKQNWVAVTEERLNAALKAAQHCA